MDCSNFTEISEIRCATVRAKGLESERFGTGNLNSDDVLLYFPT